MKSSPKKVMLPLYRRKEKAAAFAADFKKDWIPKSQNHRASGLVLC
jgi:hypothetical protein